MNIFVWGTSIGLGISALVVKARKEREKNELNDDIIGLIQDRMEKGRKQYGHGLLKGDKDWTKEALEEALDMSIYLSAKLAEMKSQ